MAISSEKNILVFWFIQKYLMIIYIFNDYNDDKMIMSYGVYIA